MSYCPKCGNKVEETMAFCPHCGTSLKVAATPGQPAPAPQGLIADKKKPKRMRNKRKIRILKKGEKQEKSEHGFIGFLIGGLILITIGIFSLLELTAITLIIQVKT